MTSANHKQDLYELLPWHENGTLDDAESEALRTLLATDLEANRQARELRVLHAAVADEPILAPNMTTNLRRLRARIDPPAPQHRSWFLPLPAVFAGARGLSFAAAALSLLVVAGFGVFRAGERAGVAHTLTSPSDVAVPSGDNVLYRVDVVDGVDAAALVKLTDTPGARVLQGPSPHGVALLAVPKGGAEHALAKLQEDPRLRFVTTVPQ
jgi:anti-sigma factor RsiW